VRTSASSRLPSAAALSFAARVLIAVRRIPPGRASTYGDIAALAGRPRAARGVGAIMRECRAPGTPCHRVVAANGRLGGFGGDTPLKRLLLVAEGIAVVGTRIKDWRRVRWPGGSAAPHHRNRQSAASVSPGKRRPAR
jgi:methylated-DNA-protein-cysteine methyltransferase related protein